MAQTAVTYPYNYIQTMTGGQIEDVLEHLRYPLQHRSLSPAGRRHGPRRRPRLRLHARTRVRGQADLRTRRSTTASALQAAKSYKVAGWASVNEQSGAPIWDVVGKAPEVGQAAQPVGRRA